MRFKLVTIVTLTVVITASCISQTQEAVPIQSVESIVPSTPNLETPRPVALWLSASIPDKLRANAMEWGIPLTDAKENATYWLDLNLDASEDNPGTIWIYALVAPFPTVTDEVKFSDLKSFWTGSPDGLFAGPPLLMTEQTYQVFSSLWGEPTSGAVMILPSGQVLDTAWTTNPAWAIIPFEELQPRWKVLSVDGQSPIHKDFNQEIYPLAVTFSVQSQSQSSLESSFSLPVSNRDPDMITTIILTGVTALVRATAYTMEKKGVLYPGRDIRSTMLEADIAHISNEIPFFSGCGYPPNPGLKKLVFCTYPRYMELLEDIGTDIIELTGNHFGDYGPEAMGETLDIYNQASIPYYGGGANLADALKPSLIEHNSNRIAFLGCNRPDIGKFPTATDARPGAAPCDFNYLTDKIQELVNQGYLVVTTFQWNERDEYDPVPIPEQLEEFHLMADSGATIVSGSQAHFPMAMEFYNESFLHYGLGNLFFDQMGECCAGIYNRWEFMDRYTIYDGKLISLELLTMMLEDYSRPRPMTTSERNRFLNEYYYYSGWTPLYPTPVPQPTVTLTPIQLPVPITTSVP